MKVHFTDRSRSFTTEMMQHKATFQISSVYRYRHTAGILLLAAGGVALLSVYLYYLNDTLCPLTPDPNSRQWPWIKSAIFLCWLTVTGWCILASQKRFSLKGYTTDRYALLRAIAAGLFFCISISAYQPPDIDLSAYFSINTIAFAMLAYALFSVTSVQQCCTRLGNGFLRLLALPPGLWIAAGCIMIFCTSYSLSWLLFKHIPWIDDTIVQLVHAKIILQGHWVAQSVHPSNFFDMKWMINDGKWYSQYPPGHIFMLAIGIALHHASMVNPFLGACTCIAVWLLAKELYGGYVARIAALLTMFCVYLIILSSEFMNNSTSLLTGTLFLWAYFRILNRRGWGYAIVAGAMLGYCFITRPYSAFGLAIAPAGYALYLIATQHRIYLKPMAIMAGVFLCFVIFQLYFNIATTGYPFLFGYQRLQGDRHNPFTQVAIQKMTGERLYRNLRINLQRLVFFNRMLFEWPLPAMGLVAFVLSIRGRRRDECLLFFTILFMFLSVQFVANLDIGWGPRLLYELNTVLIVLCAKALTMLPPLLRVVTVQHRPLRYYYGCGLTLLALFYCAAFQYNLKLSTIRELYVLNHREGNPDFYQYIVDHVKQPAIVFVPAEKYKFVSFTNPPTSQVPVIFAIDNGDANKQLLKQCPQRNAYFITLHYGNPADYISVGMIRPAR